MKFTLLAFFVFVVILFIFAIAIWTQKSHREAIWTNRPSMCLIVEKLEAKCQHKQSQGPGGKHLDKVIVPRVLKRAIQNGGVV